MNLDRNVTLCPDVLCQEVSGEMVLLELSGERYFGMNDVGTRIWQLLSESGSPRAVLDAMLEEFDVDRDQLAADLNAYLDELVEAGLARVSEQ